MWQTGQQWFTLRGASVLRASLVCLFLRFPPRPLVAKVFLFSFLPSFFSPSLSSSHTALVMIQTQWCHGTVVVISSESFRYLSPVTEKSQRKKMGVLWSILDKKLKQIKQWTHGNLKKRNMHFFFCVLQCLTHNKPYKNTRVKTRLNPLKAVRHTV